MPDKPDDQRAGKVQARARRLWEEAGSPLGGPQAYENLADDLISIEETGDNPTRPIRPRGGDPDVEPLEALENQGEFPTLTDQGEDNTTPLRLGDRKKALE
ncbi:DUF2934 domain-containing protein [Glycocaulis sp.]|uniref:DUF2934 domain-containing protein n=1 Tax=Glycocaulis sp. TaxID=1969725 RepID=UPI003D20DD68